MVAIGYRMVAIGRGRTPDRNVDTPQKPLWHMEKQPLVGVAELVDALG
jgi:hypothetical protein